MTAGKFGRRRITLRPCGMQTLLVLQVNAGLETIADVLIALSHIPKTVLLVKAVEKVERARRAKAKVVLPSNASRWDACVWHMWLSRIKRGYFVGDGISRKRHF